MKILKRFMSILVVLAMIMIGLSQLSSLTERKASLLKYKAFYQQQANFDVLFMGTSHVINGIYPMELWNDYGIVSYNFGGHANPIAISYWQMVNAFDYTTPKLVVIDGFALSEDWKVLKNNKSYAHLSLDSIPFSINKIKAVRDLFEKDDQLEFLFEFDIYHNRWKELGQSDFDSYMANEKGAEFRIGVAVPDDFSAIDKNAKMLADTIGVEYLEKMITYCQERNIAVLLTYLPFPASAESQKEANRMFEIARKYDVRYLDFMTLRNLIDFDTDCYDSGSHLNPSGARKITAYLGQDIMSHYDIMDQRNNIDYKDWHKSYEIYVQSKIKNIKNQKEIKSYLMLLNDENFSFCICIPEGSKILKNEILEKLLKNVGIETDKLSDDEDALIMVDRYSDTVVSSDFSKHQKTSFGEVAVLDEENEHGLYLGENLQMRLEDSREVGIVVFSNSDLRVADTKRFRESDTDYMVVGD